MNDQMQGSHLPNNKLMREFIERRFPKPKYVVANGNTEEQIPGHLRYHKLNELVVLDLTEEVNYPAGSGSVWQTFC